MSATPPTAASTALAPALGLPIASAAISAVLWGLFWIPIRFFEALGLHGPWAGIAMNLGAAGVLAIWLLLRREPLGLTPRAWIGGILVGVAFSFYSIALAYSDVARVVLIFYLSPVWGKIIEWAFLRMAWRWTTTLALCAALAGAYLVLGGEVAPGALNLGDWLALISGISWAVGASLIFLGGRPSLVGLTGFSCTAAILVSIPFAVAVGWPTPQPSAVVAALASGALYVVPLLVMTLWAAQRLSPGILTILLTAEILSGVVSSAILLDEPFGPMQVAGAGLIILAATSEILAFLGKRGKTRRP